MEKLLSVDQIIAENRKDDEDDNDRKGKREDEEDEDDDDEINVFEEIKYDDISMYLTGFVRMISYDTSKFNPVKDTKSNTIKSVTEGYIEKGKS